MASPLKSTCNTGQFACYKLDFLSTILHSTGRARVLGQTWPDQVDISRMCKLVTSSYLLLQGSTLKSTLGSRYPNLDTEAFRYPNRVGGLGIRTKQRSRYPNKKMSDLLSERISSCLILGVSVSEHGSWYPNRGQKVIKSRYLMQNFEGLYTESSKVYAEPLQLAQKLRKSHFTNFGNFLIPGVSVSEHILIIPTVRIKFVRIANHSRGVSVSE